MLLLVGLGIYGFKGLSIYAIDRLKQFDHIMLESYTSIIEDDIKYLESLLDKSIKQVPRWYVEDGREILELARDSNVALLAYGDPLIATTHIDLLIRARNKGIDYDIIHNTSAITAIIARSGLHVYKLGRVASMVNDKQANVSIYKIIHSNLLQGLHTLLLLEYDKDKGFFLDPKDALLYLLEIDKDMNYNIISKDTFAIVASRIGVDDKVYAGKIKSLLSKDLGKPPHSIIITGSLHFTEVDALRLLELLDEPRDNSKGVRNKARIMLDKYIPNAKVALNKAKSLRLKGYDTSILLDNAERYINDAEEFLARDEYELAILSIGYGEGLIDALGFLLGINLWE